MQLPFFKQETINLRTQETFTGNKCLIYIEEKIVKNDQLTTITGNILKTIGLFWFEVDGEFYELQVPIPIEIQFSEKKNETKRLRDNLPILNYTVFQLNRGDAFIYDINHRQDTNDLRTFIVKLLENGNLPATVSYNDSIVMLMKMFDTTGNNGLGVSMASYEFLISELYRWKHDESYPFRLKYNKDRPYDFKSVRSTKVPQLNSTFTGLIGEDIGTQILAGVVRNRAGNKFNRESPIEKTIKY